MTEEKAFFQFHGTTYPTNRSFGPMIQQSVHLKLNSLKLYSKYTQDSRMIAKIEPTNEPGNTLPKVTVELLAL